MSTNMPPMPSPEVVRQDYNLHVSTHRVMMALQKLEKVAEIANKERTIESLHNEIEMLKEDLECVHLWLDSYNVPRESGKYETFSIVGRIQILLEDRSKG